MEVINCKANISLFQIDTSYNKVKFSEERIQWRAHIPTIAKIYNRKLNSKPHFASYEVSGEFPAKRPVTRSFDVFFDLRLPKR